MGSLGYQWQRTGIRSYPRLLRASISAPGLQPRPARLPSILCILLSTMSAHHPRQRLPVSCEPCRVRKIRCSRDTPPCGTCVRRRVPPEQCVYSTRRQPIPSKKQPQQSQPQPQPLENSSASPDTPVQPRYHGPAGEPNPDLVARIEKLEQLLHAKDQPQEKAPRPPSVPQLDPELERRRESEPATAFAGTLISSTSGHVRFLPINSAWRIVDRASQEGPFPSQESAAADTPSGPYPFGEHDAENRPNILAKLPPTEYCDQLTDVYFQSFAPVSFSTPNIISVAEK